MFKYTIIISQYYHSRHIFIVNHDADFIQKARSFAKELMLYKRDADNQRVMYLGDLDPEYSDGKSIRPRYNINDSGDIYFIQSNYVNYCKDVAIEYHDTSKREARGFQSKRVTDEIGSHHDYRRVKEIVERHFEIV